MTRTGGGALTLSEDDRGPGARRIGRLVALLLVVALGVGGWVGVRRAIDSFTPAQCEVRASGQSFTWAPDQASNTAVITAIAEAGFAGRPFQRVVGADTYTPLAGAAFLVLPGDEDIVAAADRLAGPA